MHDMIRDITLSIVAAWVVGLAAHRLRQPLLLAYLLAGFALGPTGFRLIESAESIAAISELGLIFLLFMIGLEIDLKKVLSAGRSITITALVQIAGGTVIGIAFFRMFGLGLSHGKWDALYLAIAAALSSTVIIVKVLYDKQEIDTLTGRITLGVLVLQDIAAILFLAIQPNLDHLAPSTLVFALGRAGVLIAAALALSRYCLPYIFRSVARLPELVEVGALAWCFLIGELAAQLHLSREMGALMAGVALSTFPYALDVTAKVTSLRDFFLTLFFVGLGMQIPWPSVSLLGWAVLFAVFVVVSRLLTTFGALYLMRQGLRTSLIPAINLSQVSEFSLVVLSIGSLDGHLASANTAGMAALGFAGLAVFSTFGMAHSGPIVRHMIPLLKRIGLRDLDSADDVHAEGGGAHASGRIIFLGFFRSASSLLEEMGRHAPDLICDTTVVDFSPVARAGLIDRKVRVIYGDISQRDTLLHAGVEQAEVIISTVPDSLLKGTSNERLVRMLRSLNANARIIATADVLSQAEALMRCGADYVSVPRLTESRDLLEAVRAAADGLIDEKASHLRNTLEGRIEVLH